MSRKNIIAYSDGGCNPNPGPGGWGIYIVYENKSTIIHIEAYGGNSQTTNNIMELTAAIEALETCPIDSDIELVSDSLYVINGLMNGKQGTLDFSGWIKAWLKNGWKTTENKPVKNKEQWIKLYEVASNHLKKGSIITLKWVKSHNGIEGNEKVDQLATKGREEL
jgi:ribonuclease HI